MYIRKIEIENFRQLKSIFIDVEDELTLIIGKNNSGKTSILMALDKLLNDKGISLYDFNLEFRVKIEEKLKASVMLEDDFSEFGIKLRLYIEYTDIADLSNINDLIMDLDPSNNMLVLGFEYLISQYDDYLKFRSAYEEYKRKSLTFEDFFKESHKKYFKLYRRSYYFDTKQRKIDESNYIDLEEKKISLKKVINFQYITAKRNVQNKESEKSLSEQSNRIYQATEKHPEQEKPLEEFKIKVRGINQDLSQIYDDIFKGVIDKVKLFGGGNVEESQIKVTSTIGRDSLLSANTTVVYTQDDSDLPESHNGLGYMNLINMIFEIEILVHRFLNQFADINLLFIEEPEAHTHPQMQYVFIKNIKSLLKNRIQIDGIGERNLQYMITSHSSHIVADSDFEDIKYLKKAAGEVFVKNLKELKEDYALKTEQYQFLKQYLTLNRAELFFADKVILYEGDTERILLPSMMKKLDIENREQNRIKGLLPLCSQNISLVEVGAYVQIFEKFLEFIGIKTLVITDIDSNYEQEIIKNGELEKYENGNNKTENIKCSPSDPKAEFTSNSALKHFFGMKDIQYYLELKSSNKVLSKKNKQWESNPQGWLRIAYQTEEEDGYHARSFEDAFIHINRDFINDSKSEFKGLKNRSFFDDSAKDAFELADKCIDKKTHFALDIIYFSDETMGNWKVPAYIKEGLEWLQQS